MSFVLPQPQPKPSSAPPVWPLVIADARARLSGPVAELLFADMAERDAFGRAKYPFPLAAFNGRDFLRDAYDEALDLTVYLKGEIEEGDPSGAAAVEYPLALASALRLREALERRQRARGAVREALVAVGADLPADWPDTTAVALAGTGLDSLAAIEAVMQVEEALDIIEVPDQELARVVTIGDLAKVAEQALAVKARRA